MVDRLKSSLENLDPPECPTCRIEMRWFESKLIEADPALIEHKFVCSSCGTTRTRQDKVEKGSSNIPPAKLSRGIFPRAA